MIKPLLRIHFKAGFERDGEIWVEKGRCYGCHQNTIVLCADSSEDEYGPAQVCQKCISLLFDSNEKERLKDENECYS